MKSLSCGSLPCAVVGRQASPELPLQDCAIIPLDLLIEIAIKDEAAWYALYRINEEFKEYSKTHHAAIKYMRCYQTIMYRGNVLQYRLFGELHSIDCPAHSSSALDIYYIGGVITRIDGPAFIDKIEGREEWMRDGLLDRAGDLPAIIAYDGSYRAYYRRGALHRENNKAAIIMIENGRKYKEYWQNGARNIIPEIERGMSQPIITAIICAFVFGLLFGLLIFAIK
jgi:hypothetical protein